MRLSTERGDAGYPTYQDMCARGEWGHVYLNGVEISNVHTADEEERFLLKAKVDENGHLILDKERRRVVEERLEGDVAIVMRPRA